jgi:hypothetical protein
VGQAHGQVIDDVDLKRVGGNVVLTIRMAQPIQFRRSVNAASDDLVQVYYDVLPGGERPSFQEGERKSAGGAAGLPRVTVTEDGGPSALTNRKLVVRIDGGAAPMRARAGRDNRSIEIQIDGLGAKAAELAALPQANAPAALASGVASSAAANPAAPTPGLVAAVGSPSDAEIEARSAQLLGQARAAMARNDTALAIETLNEALNLPPNSGTREAQEMIGTARLARGDVAGARREFELYLALYAKADGIGGAKAAGPDPAADRVRMQLKSVMLVSPKDVAAAPGRAAAVAPALPSASSTQLNGSVSQYFYGGSSRTNTQLMDTPLGGQLPQVVAESTFSGPEQKQLVSSVDLNWRSRDVDRELRFGFRDSYTVNGMPGQPNAHKPTALYLDWREFAAGLSGRVGRQSGMGGGVLGRFDGLQAGWRFQPKWKLNIVAGKPTDDLLDTRRWFAGTSLDVEGLLPHLGGSAYTIEQKIDGQIDRRAVGMDLRWFEPNASVFTQLEYDLVQKGLNTASLQGTYTLTDNTTFNVLLDHRATPMLMLGNALFFADPSQAVLPRTINDLLKFHTLDELRQQVTQTTAYATQGLLGLTTPINSHWQLGGDLRLTRVGAIAPVAVLLPAGLPSTGNIWSASVQAIGTNLYSERDTHVFNFTLLRGPTYSGWLMAYNNLSVPAEGLQIEPSVRFYSQTSNGNVSTRRLTPGMRLAWRGGPRWVLESELSVEAAGSQAPAINERSTRLFYTLGYRLDL